MKKLINNTYLPEIAICTGGTGGHVFPAKSLAESFLKSNYKVKILIDERGYLNGNGWSKKISIRKIKSIGFHQKNIFFIFKMFFLLGIGFLQSFYIFLKSRPKLLVSFGSYASIPPVLAAIILRIPIVMHEQNAVLGKSHRLFLKFTEILTLSFQETKNVPKNMKTVFTGLPIRSDFMTAKNKTTSKKDAKITILISGGSQGARIFAEDIPKTFLELPLEWQQKLRVYHQCRQEFEIDCMVLWQKTAVEYILKPFFNNMPVIMWESSLIIGRAGASTIAEINVLGKNAIYIPFAKATDNHQELNALNEKRHHGAKVILEKDFTPKSLAKNIKEFLLEMELNKKEKTFLPLNPVLKLQEVVESVINR